MHPYHVDWFMKEEEKRRNMHKENEIEMLNRQFSNLIEKLSYQVDRALYRNEEMQFSRKLVSSSIWRLCYRNNLINPKVLTLQAGWLLYILKQERGVDTLKNYNHVEKETAQLIMRMRHVDYHAFEAVIREYPEVRSIL